jgi:hypothetical protein
MSDALTEITNLILSPPKIFAAGIGLFTAISTFFAVVESRARKSTKDKISQWLRVKNFEMGLVADQSLSWSGTFAALFDTIFGSRHLTWKCFMLSCVASYSVFSLVYCANGYFYGFAHPLLTDVVRTFRWAFIVNVIPDYISLLKTRFLLGQCINSSVAKQVRFVILDFVATSLIAFAAVLLYSVGTSNVLDFLSVNDSASFLLKSFLVNGDTQLWTLPAFFSFIWTFLYAASGFLIKSIRASDRILQWVNSIFDLETYPLSAIGLVAGSLVAILYWGWAAFRHFVLA